jgi:tRNA(Arg) A34 adenosine deaminase TadA
MFDSRYINEFDYCTGNEITYRPTKTERNYAFMAYVYAFESIVSKGRHGAVLVGQNDTIVSKFVNRHPLCSTERYSVHAEDGLINQVMSRPEVQDLRGHTLIVVRSTFNSGQPTNSRPCKRCYNECKSSGIKRIIYSKSNNEYGCIYL